MSNQLLCMLYAEFDNAAGPRVVCQSPPGCVSDADFDLVSHTIITQADLSGSVVSVVHPGLTAAGGQGARTAPVKLLSFPVSLRHERYARNSLLFALVLVLPSWADTAPYEPVLRKLGSYLYSMEVESEFLSRRERRGGAGAGGNSNSSGSGGGSAFGGSNGGSAAGGVAPEDGAPRLAAMLAAIRDGLNARGECFVAVGEGGDASDNTVALKLLPSLPLPPPVRDHDVPVRVRDLDALAGAGAGLLGATAASTGAGGAPGGGGLLGAGLGVEDSGWDMALRVLLPYIDGVAYARAIAEAADMELPLVRRALRHLLHWGLIRLTDVFQFGSVYATQPQGLQRLLREPQLQRACARYASSGRPGASTTAGGSAAGTGLVPRDVLLRLYMAFGAGTRVCDVAALAGTAERGVDDRRLVTWGVMHGVLRRVHKYPVPLEERRGGGAEDAGAGGGGGDEGEERGTATLGAPAVAAATGGGGDSGAGGGGSSGHTGGARGASSPPTDAAPRLGPRELALLDGSRHCDELCCSLRMSQAALESAIAAHGGFVYVLR
jgi:hypothetical protein